MMTTKLVRSSNGLMVHASTCIRKGKKTIPWIWAEDKTRADVKAAETAGVRWCRYCDPLAVIEAA